MLTAGTSGFIGHRLCPVLAAAAHHVVAMTRNPAGHTPGGWPVHESWSAAGGWPRWGGGSRGVDAGSVSHVQAVLIDGAYTSAAHLGPDGPAAAGLGLGRHLVQQARARA